jgi:hypothetical protein
MGCGERQAAALAAARAPKPSRPNNNRGPRAPRGEVTRSNTDNQGAVNNGIELYPINTFNESKYQEKIKRPIYES